MATTTTRWRRKGFWAFAAIALTAMLVAVFANLNLAVPANAGISDPNIKGTQWDPMATGCNQDAYTAETFPVIDESTQRKTGIVEIRYSPKCGTNWIRVTSFINGIVEKMIGTAKEPLNGIEADNGPGVSYSYQVKAPGDECIEYRVAIVVKKWTVTDGTAHGFVCG